MEIKNRSFLILTVLLLAGHFSSLSLYAQISASSGYFIDPSSSSDEPRFIQRLVWSGGDYALYYAITIERREGAVFVNHLQRNTNDLFIDISLHPGEYRFRVIPYDILERPGQPSVWVEFEILPALMPFLDDVSGHSDDQSNIIIIHGSNIMPESEIALLDENNIYFIPDSVEVLNDGNIELIFDSSLLPPGDYEIIIRNPGGLQARAGGLNITYPEPEPLRVTQMQPEPEIAVESEIEEEQPQIVIKPELEDDHKINLEEQIFITDESKSDTEHVTEYEPHPQIAIEPEFEDEQVIELEAEAEIAAAEHEFIAEAEIAAGEPEFEHEAEPAIEFFENPFIFNLGIGFSPLFFLDDNEIESNNFPNSFFWDFSVIYPVSSFYMGVEFLMNFYSGYIDSSFASFGFNLLMRKYFNNEVTAFNFRLGTEIISAQEISLLYLNSGLSFFWLFNRQLYLETGVIYSHPFDFNNNIFSGIFRPVLSVGLNY